MAFLTASFEKFDRSYKTNYIRAKKNNKFMKLKNDFDIFASK